MKSIVKNERNSLLIEKTKVIKLLTWIFLVTILFPTILFGQNASKVEKLDGITNGPQLGRITSHSIKVWARTKQPGSFSVIYSVKSDLSDATTSTAVQTTWATDGTGVVELTNLKANTKYYYALVLDGKIADTRVNGKINSFLTLPDAKDYVDTELNPKGLFNFSFEIGTGNSQGRGKGTIAPTYATMLQNLKDHIYFQIQNGD